MSLKSIIEARNRTAAAEKPAPAKQALPPKPKAAAAKPQIKAPPRPAPISRAAHERASAIAHYAARVGETAAMAPLLESNIPVAAAKSELDRIAGIRAAVLAANRINPLIDPALADRYAADGLSVDQAKAKLSALKSVGMSGEQPTDEAPDTWDAIATQAYARRAK